MKNVKYSVCEKVNGQVKVLLESFDWFECHEYCKTQAEQWVKDGYIVEELDGNGFVAHEDKNYDLVHCCRIRYEYIPQVGAIDPSIKGYEFVKNVVFCGGSERTGDNMLFVFKRNVDNELHALCEVAERTRESLADLEARYPEDEYVIHWGCIITLPKGAAVLPSGGDIIDLYLS